MGESILFTIQNEHIAVITLNRPQAANALSAEMLRNLQLILQKIEFNSNIRCVILTGTGEKAFCAGADLKERIKLKEDQVLESVSLIQRTAALLEALPQPVIAAMNGSALGGGLELAMACDLRIAAESAMLGLPETGLAIIPGAGGTQRLPRLIGRGKAKELIYTGNRVTAHKAKEIGLVEQVTAPRDLMPKAEELAAVISANGPIAVRQAKFAINKGLETDLATGLAIEQKAYEHTIPTKDRREGLQAFQEKRRAVYKGI
ncbi:MULTISPECIES: enoyl-CoA hydratase [unclassified Bacillus (in: firmicutes)]|uniref:enoyl-CoA hydratase n=1 Tax=unclassified Bacillus (in: firmicutes) TaxID=185979 RepID=UPI002282DF6A|nr:enoyl-CoA hydratase [Bacillus sp. S20C3]MCY8202741.1 enoyl-CoA hydratase [Bacillus sp. N12A5]MCY8287706.1 enoyl-CoA hydratase [Bacillus sp. N13C7]MCY8639815.1 enoyl-CoA hydratase [Bacillus sp. S17B2]MCY8720928.1 enoyl-CoA hydratase [Bacillus sp. S10C12M]MCY9142845.1 enoyl-CoA hydratase [Bacillus sp. T9C1]